MKNRRFFRPKHKSEREKATLAFEACETPLYSPLVVQATPKVGRGAPPRRAPADPAAPHGPRARAAPGPHSLRVAISRHINPSPPTSHRLSDLTKVCLSDLTTRARHADRPVPIQKFTRQPAILKTLLRATSESGTFSAPLRLLRQTAKVDTQAHACMRVVSTHAEEAVYGRPADHMRF